MHHSVDSLARLVGGEVVGDGSVVITAARPVSGAGPGDITFVEDDRHARQLRQSSACAAVVGLSFEDRTRSLIRVAKPFDAFIAIVECLRGPAHAWPLGIHSYSSISPSAAIGRAPSVGPFVTIGDHAVIGDRCRLMSGAFVGDGCRMGSDCVLYPHVVLYSGTVLGDRVTVHAGTVLGGHGFGYRSQQGAHVKTPQLGHVEVGDDAEIGANTTIDRGTFHATRIGAGTKIDNLVQIAHNCQIGRHNLIVGQVGIAGSTRTGDYVVIAGQAGIRDHVTIGDGAVIGAMAGVMKDVPAGERMLGIPATPEREQYWLVAAVHKLPELRDKVKKLAKHVEELETGRLAELRAAVLRMEQQLDENAQKRRSA